MARELRPEVDAPRTLHIREVLATEGDELPLEGVALLLTRHGDRLDDGLHLLTEVVVGDAEDGHVGD